MTLKDGGPKEFSTTDGWGGKRSIFHEMEYAYCGADECGNSVEGTGNIMVPVTSFQTGSSLGDVVMGGMLSYGFRALAKGFFINSAAKTSTKLLTQFTSSTIDDAVSLTMKQKELHIFANKLHPKPWLNQLSTQMGGNQNVIKSALQNANGRILPNAQGVFNTPVNVGGVNFTIRGYINQGTPIINSIFIP